MRKKLMSFILVSQLILLSMASSMVLPRSPLVLLPPKTRNNSYISTSSWSNATVISDDNTSWNVGASARPCIAIDNNGTIHAIWHDDTDGAWGTDKEIMYANNTGSGWSNATVISDDSTLWNNGSSGSSKIAVDNDGNLHVVWNDDTDGEWGTDYEIMYANRTASGWSNATVISDDSTSWNDNMSIRPSIAVDNDGNIHVAWQDSTNGEWGTDYEIMYANNTGSGWSNATAISDIYGWNDGYSSYPSLAVDDDGNLHVAWQDDTAGEWGGGMTDGEIMYASRTVAGWSNATVISDDSTLWNDEHSSAPSLAVDDDGNIHVVWYDATNGEWGTDVEIMYAKHTAAGWSNATVISDDNTGWNNGDSYHPAIAIGGDGNVHVVWYDETNGEWGTDVEIMYAKLTAAGWSNAIVISDDSTLWNDGYGENPNLAVDNDGKIHVAWSDDTDGEWGTDYEIMYVKYTASKPQDLGFLFLLLLVMQQPADYTLIFIGIGAAAAVVIIIIVIKKKE